MKKRIKIGLSVAATSALVCSSCISLVSCNQQPTKEPVPDETSKEPEQEPEITEFKYETVNHLNDYMLFRSYLRNYSVISEYERTMMLNGNPFFIADDKESPYYGARFAIICKLNKDGEVTNIYTTFLGCFDEDFATLQKYDWDLEKVKECRINWFNGNPTGLYIKIPKYLRIFHYGRLYSEKSLQIKGVFWFYGIGHSDYHYPYGDDKYDENKVFLYNDLPNRNVDFNETATMMFQFIGFFNRTCKNNTIKYEKDFRITFPKYLKQIPYLETYDYGPTDITITLDFSKIDNRINEIVKNPDRISLFSTKLAIKMPTRTDIYFDSKIEGNTKYLYIDCFDYFKLVGPEVFKNIITINNRKTVVLPKDCYYYDNSFPTDFTIIGGKKLKAPVQQSTIPNGETEDNRDGNI